MLLGVMITNLKLVFDIKVEYNRLWGEDIHTRSRLRRDQAAGPSSA